RVGKVEVEQDELGLVLTRQLRTEAALHGGDDLDVAVAPEDPCDQPKVRQVVLDVEDLALGRGLLLPRWRIAVQALEALHLSLDDGQIDDERGALPEGAVDTER